MSFSFQEHLNIDLRLLSNTIFHSFDPHYSADEVLQHILDLLNDFVNYYAPTSYPVNVSIVLYKYIYI